MSASQRFGSGLMLLAALVVPGWLAHHLVLGVLQPDLTILAASSIAGCAGYALGRGASSLR